MKRRSSRPPFEACKSTSSYPMPVTTGCTTFSRLKQKMGRSPSADFRPPKPVDFSNISLTEQAVYLGSGKLAPLAGSKIFRQFNGAVANARKAAHGVPERFEEPPYLAVTPLPQHHAIPAIDTLAGPIAIDALEAGGYSVQKNAFAQPRKLRGAQFPLDPCKVFALEAVAWVHQLVRELARVRQQQQARAVDVESADCNPTARRQARKNRRQIGRAHV